MDDVPEGVVGECAGAFCLPLRAMPMIRVKNIFNRSPVKAGVFFA
jgi:hypothetical protein